MVINCIAVDDEPLALEKIGDYISKVGYLNLLECFNNGADALVYLKNHKVDLIFLDIQMDILSGIELIESLHKKPNIILTTAYDKYAIKAFELDVIDYLLKPISFPRFLKASEKLYDSLFLEKNRIKHIEEKSDNVDENYFFVKSGSSTVKINYTEILYIEGMKDYLSIHTLSDKVLTLLSFKKLEDILPDTDFIRIHRSYIIAVKHIERIKNNHVKIKGNDIPIGRKYKKKFTEHIDSKNLNR